MSFTDQGDYRVRLECGERGLRALTDGSANHFAIVEFAAQLDASSCVPVLRDGCFVRV